MRPVSLAILAFLCLGGSQTAASEPKAKPYGLSIEALFQGCQLLQGDLLWSYQDFTPILQREYDRRRQLILYYTPYVPDKCVFAAVKLARGSGFKNVQTRKVPRLPAPC
jgi:hypothetical protein